MILLTYKGNLTSSDPRYALSVAAGCRACALRWRVIFVVAQGLLETYLIPVFIGRGVTLGAESSSGGRVLVGGISGKIIAEPGELKDQTS